MFLSALFILGLPLDLFSLRLVRFILMSVHVKTNNPGPSGEASKSVRIGSQTGQANFQLLDDRIHVVEHPVGKFLFSQGRYLLDSGNPKM